MDWRSLVRMRPSPHGPRPAFAGLDAVRALWLLAGEGMGRAALGRRLGLGEGSVRSLLAYLRKQGLVTCTRAGCALTGAGERSVGGLRKAIGGFAWMPGSRLSFGKRALALHLRGAAKRIERTKGIAQRDAALMAGAFGTTSLVFYGRKLELPCEYPVDQRIVEPVYAAFALKRGDAVVLAYGADGPSAERGAWAALAATL
jgi:hypothetical protein